jgi:hypothetical protein
VNVLLHSQCTVLKYCTELFIKEHDVLSDALALASSLVQSIMPGLGSHINDMYNVLRFYSCTVLEY